MSGSASEMTQENFMQADFLRSTLVAAGTALTLLAAGCATQQPAGSAAAKPAAEQAGGKSEAAKAENSLFIAYNDQNGRIYVLGDPALYRLYLQTGEVALTRTRVGAGPDGATVVFGMNKDDAKTGGPTQAEQFYDGARQPQGPFYGEVLKDGRYYVFNDWKDMAEYLKHGEVPLTYTEIGAGPDGATVIYALNKESAKQGRPTAAIEAFQRMHPSKAAQ
jgi:hypothetical protein